MKTAESVTPITKKERDIIYGAFENKRIQNR